MFSPEVRQRARIVPKSQGKYDDSQGGGNLFHCPQDWLYARNPARRVRQHEQDTGSDDGGLITAVRQFLKESEREEENCAAVTILSARPLLILRRRSSTVFGKNDATSG